MQVNIPSLNADEWIAGQNRDPILISMQVNIPQVSLYNSYEMMEVPKEEYLLACN